MTSSPPSKRKIIKEMDPVSQLFERAKVVTGVINATTGFANATVGAVNARREAKELAKSKKLTKEQLLAVSTVEGS